ncbi:hypothetical protein NLI96_g4782 [Meripilus lineatus]|uniref:non-specific serine/threonine protein kinase n=1 Tax=Meripilus lineatus TaxID=2056292 RepID=A0AAD5V3Y6_9APHY|nr:hypothetical protein NLI96_g4782 [Physisporinus lineatus]
MPPPSPVGIARGYEVRRRLVEVSVLLHPHITFDGRLRAAMDRGDWRLSLQVDHLIRKKQGRRAVAQSLVEGRAQLFLDLSYEILQKRAWGTSDHLQTRFRPAPTLVVGDDFGRRLHKTMTSLAHRSGKTPSALFITHVTIENPEPVISGAFGDVIKGTLHGQEVALKRMRHYQRQSKEERESLLKDLCKEVLIWSHLEHQNILPLYGIDRDSFASSSSLCLVSPWMEFGDITDFLKTTEVTKRDEVIERLIKEIFLGLFYLHDQNIVHGDLRPPNILIDREQHVRIADFGLAYFADSTQSSVSAPDAGPRSPERCCVDDIFGDDYKYMPSKETDVFALGTVYYEIRTGGQPFKTLQKLRSLKTRNFSVIPLFSTLPRKASLIISQCWEWAPRQRPTIAELLELYDRKPVEDGSEFWSEDLEKVFVEGLREYWESPWATYSRGRSRWRNQFLVDHLKKFGIERSKKQVASHIQVLRDMWRGEPATPDPPESSSRYDSLDELSSSSASSTPDSMTPDFTQMHSSAVPMNYLSPTGSNMGLASLDLGPFSSSPPAHLQAGVKLEPLHATPGLYNLPPIAQSAFPESVDLGTSCSLPPPLPRHRVTKLSLWTDGMVLFEVDVDRLALTGPHRPDHTSVLIRIKLSISSIDDIHSSPNLHGFQGCMTFSEPWNSDAKCITKSCVGPACMSTEIGSLEATNSPAALSNTAWMSQGYSTALPDSCLTRCKWLETSQDTITQQIVFNGIVEAAFVFHLERTMASSSPPSVELVGYSNATIREAAPALHNNLRYCSGPLLTPETCPTPIFQRQWSL